MAEDPDEHNMIIPLHHGIVKGMILPLRTKLYQGSILLSITGYDKIKVRWYQSSIFRQLITVVGFTIAIYSGQSWVMGFVAAASAGLTALMMFIMQTMVLAIAVQYATDEIAEEIGPEAALITSMVAMAASRKFKGSFNLFGSNMPTAETFMFAGKSMLSSAQHAQQKLISEVNEESNDFAEDAEAQTKLLEQKKSEIFPEPLLPFSYLEEPFNHAKPDTSTEPDRFYDFVHIGNIGTLSLDVIENYVNVQLMLPKPEVL